MDGIREELRFRSDMDTVLVLTKFKYVEQIFDEQYYYNNYEINAMKCLDVYSSCE